MSFLLTSEVSKHIDDFINFYLKKNILPIYPNRKKHNSFSLYMNN